MYSSVCVDLLLFSFGVIHAYWFSLILNGVQFTDPHTFPLHIISSACSTSLELCIEGGQGWGGWVYIFIKRYYIMLYIWRLARDLDEIMHNIRRRTSNVNASLICTHRYVLVCACFRLLLLMHIGLHCI